MQFVLFASTSLILIAVAWQLRRERPAFIASVIATTLALAGTTTTLIESVDRQGGAAFRENRATPVR